jgi:hypothetical protein
MKNPRFEIPNPKEIQTAEAAEKRREEPAAFFSANLSALCG